MSREHARPVHAGPDPARSRNEFRDPGEYPTPSSGFSVHAGPTSDVDLLYTLQPGRTLGWEIDDLADELAELFGRPVDLVSRRAVHAKLRDQVLAEARPLYAA